MAEGASEGLSRVTHRVLASARIGLWAIEIVEGEEPQMYADATMCDLLAIPFGLPPERVYHAWYDNIHPDHYGEVAKAVEKMIAGAHAEVQYPWNDSRKGQVYVRCGGVRSFGFTRGIRLEGCHQDVTDLVHFQQKAEKTDLQNRFIVKMLLALPSPVFIKSASDSRYQLCNNLFAENVGRRPEDVSFATDFDLFPEETARLFLEHDAETLARNGERVSFPSRGRGIGCDGRLWDKWQTCFDGDDGQRYIIGVLWDVTAAKRAEAAKGQFFANVSHDIRTPLNAIIGYSQLLKEGIDDPADRRDALDNIILSGQTLLDLVNDILDLSRLELGKIALAPERCDVVDLARHVVSALAVKPGLEDVRLYVAEPSAAMPPSVDVDVRRVRQILFNLVGNAAKFTRHGEIRVTVGFARDDARRGRLTLAVKDTGRGISEREQASVFDPFVQVGGVAKTGTGLGLSICRRLAEAMDGTISLRSTLGVGSEFTVELRNVPYHQTGVVPAACGLKPGGCALPGARVAALRILAVDDVALNLAVAKSMLVKVGVGTVVTAGGGEEALARLKAEPAGFDLVLTDVKMPGMDGFGLLRAIRGEPALAGQRVYAVTADVTEGGERDGVAFDGLLLKPITLQRMREFVEGLTK